MLALVFWWLLACGMFNDCWHVGCSVAAGAWSTMRCLWCCRRLAHGCRAVPAMLSGAREEGLRAPAVLSGACAEGLHASSG